MLQLKKYVILLEIKVEYYDIRVCINMRRVLVTGGTYDDVAPIATFVINIAKTNGHLFDEIVIFHNGTNGEECNALNSMRDAADNLEKIQGFTEWATLLDCYCDTLDDVYSWLFTFEV